MIGITILTYIVAMAIPSVRNNISSVFFIRMSTIVLFFAGILSLNSLYIQSIGSGIGIYSGYFQITLTSMYLDAFILIISSLILIARPINLNFDSKENNIRILNNLLNIPNLSISAKYCLIVLFTTLGSLFLVSSADLISMYLSIELQSFGVYILASLFRENKLASSAGLKYFLLGCLSSCLILLGSAVLYSYTGLTNLDSIYALLSVYSLDISKPVLLGLILIVGGFLFKIAAAPLHNWAADVYDDSPTIVTIWLTIMPKIAILTFLLELLISGYNVYSNNNSMLHFLNSEHLVPCHWQMVSIPQIISNLLLLSSLLSLVIGGILGLAQTKIKRLLAYSTISHVGFILLALSVNTQQSIESFIFYILQYSITNLDIFLIILAFGYILKYSNIEGYSQGKVIQSYIGNHGSLASGAAAATLRKMQNILIEKEIKFISELKSQFYYNPLLTFAISICLFSMAGIPPLIGFFSKQLVLSAAIENGYYFISIVAILVSVISASYYLKIVKVIFTENNSQSNVNSLIETETGKGADAATGILPKAGRSSYFVISVQSILSNFHSFLISSLTLSILLFILKPSILLNSCQLLSLSLYHRQRAHKANMTIFTHTE